MIMPFKSQAPEHVARTLAALDAAWNEVKSTVSAGHEEQERTRLAYIIASFVLVAVDEDELTRRAVERFRNRPQIRARNPQIVRELRSRNSR